MKTHVWIASIDWDYGPERPVADDDTKLPIRAVWFRVGYGDRYLGNAEVERLQSVYEDQGIDFYGVFVPTRGKWAAQLEQARQALGYSRGLQFDVEPYGAYLGSEAGLQEWVEDVLAPLVGGGIPPDKEISLCYDPREQWLDGWDFPGTISLVDSLAPMVYTGMYAGQGDWGHPIRAIDRARAQCPEGKTFRPILQTYHIDPTHTMASFMHTLDVGGVPQLFRRGVTPVEIWHAVANIPEEGEEPPSPPPPPPPPPEEEVEMSSQEYEEVMGHIRALQGQAHSHPAPTPPRPSPTRPRSHTVVPGDTAGAIAEANGLTIWRVQPGVWRGSFVDLNPGKPRSGDWNRIFPGEKFRVA
jgi:hypothetical protein